MNEQKHEISRADWLLIALFAVGSSVVLGFIDLAPRHPQSGVAVVFPPWINGADALMQAASAGADIVRLGSYPFIVVVRPTSVGYPARVLKRGALAVLDPQALGGCLTRRTN